MHKIAKKYGYEEYFINDTYIKKLYNMYISKHIWDKILDVLVFTAILMTVMTVILDFFGEVHTIIHIIVHSFSALILAIFGLELLRHYAQSKTKNNFFKNHWLDFTLIVFLSFYFIFVSFLEVFRIVLFDLLKPLFQDAKHARLFFKIFKR